jgi:hypothetical protein
MSKKSDKDLESLEIIVRDKSEIAAPTSEGFDKWIKERLIADAPDYYDKLRNSIIKHLDNDTPSVKVMELAAEILGLKSSGGVNITQNILTQNGNTTVNNGSSVSLEALVKQMEARDSNAKQQAEVIDVEFVDNPKGDSGGKKG